MPDWPTVNYRAHVSAVELHNLPSQRRPADSARRQTISSIIGMTLEFDKALRRSH